MRWQHVAVGTVFFVYAILCEIYFSYYQAKYLLLLETSAPHKISCRGRSFTIKEIQSLFASTIILKILFVVKRCWL